MYTNFMEVARRPRSSAEKRREEILNAAVSEFALKGLHGTSTETIAQRAGVSQPYLFRLYGTKKDLFLAAVQRALDRIEDAFRQAARENPAAPLLSMGMAYRQLLNRREELLVQMQAFAAGSDPQVQAVVRRRFADLYRLVEELSRSDPEQVRQFFATGMLLNVAAALDLPALMGTEDWAERCLGP
ncbi:MAG: TetR/AcrR family transcriptional regulator [Candidatus Dormibacteraeota bacterium]|nr:TetR/AcrR family transcriptional regulator [Candidatus Dormibacteraeota bacterium]